MLFTIPRYFQHQVLRLNFALLAFLLFACVYASAQRPEGAPRQRPSFPVSGKVVDEQNKALPYASVAIFRQRDSTLAKGVATDETGRFETIIPAGMYYLQVSFLSLETQIIPSVLVRGGPKELGTISLKAKASDLNEVTITAEKSDMELQVDKRVFNVNKDARNTGGTAAEILDNLPSVEVDTDGNVSLRGSQNVRILVNGKPSGLVGTSTTDALRQLPADLIERVEIITNPSARYEAEGEVGIINIVLKKSQAPGTNGSISVSGGYPEQFGLALNLNYRRKNINWFVGVGANYRKAPGQGESFQRFFGDSAFSYEREREHYRGGLSGNLRLGTDITLNKYNSLTISGLGKRSSGDNESDLIYRDFNGNQDLVNTTFRNEDETEEQQTLEGSLSHQRTFPQKDRKWTSDLRITFNDDSEVGELIETTEQGPARPPLIQHTDNKTIDQRWLAQTDYVHPLPKDWQVETGLRFSFQELENDFEVAILQANGDFEPIPAFSNRFIYTENVYASYLQLQKKWKALSLQAGMRMEYTDIGIELETTEPINPKEYLNWFPSANLSYKLNKQQTFQLSYSRRISRPRHRNLLPFFGLSDNRNFYSGNPDLNPEYTQSFEATWLKRNKKSSLLSSVYYRHRSDVMQRVSTADANGLIRTFPINLATQDAYGLELNGSYTLQRWWRLSGNANFFRAITTGEFEGNSLNADTYTWTARANSKWTWKKTSSFQASWRYRAPMESPQGRNLSMWSLDLAVSKEVLKGKGTLSASARDLFNTRKRRSITETDSFYSESEFQWRSRQFRLSFVYRINQQNRKRGNNQRSNSGESWDDGEF